MIDVVVDTNVLVAAFRSSLGASYRLLQTLEERRWRPVISPALALEYESVLKRDISETGLSLIDIDDFTEEVAVRTGSPIVTFNVKDFRGSGSLGIRTMSPSELLGIVRDRR